MKTIFFIFIYFVSTNVMCLELLKEVELKFEEDIDISAYQELFSKGFNNGIAYNKDKKHIIIGLPLKEKINEMKRSISIPLVTHQKQSNKLKLMVFDENGDNLINIGHHNSFSKGNFASIGNIKYLNNQLQLIDTNAKRLIIYGKDYKFLKYVDWFFPDNSNTSQPVTALFNNKAYGYQPKGFDVEHNNVTFVSEVYADSLFPDVLVMGRSTNFFDVSQYKTEIFSDVKKKEFSNMSEDTKSIVRAMLTNAVYFVAEYSFLDDGKYYIIDNYGTEIIFMSEDDTILDLYKIDSIKHLRNSEIQNMNQNYKTGIKHFSTVSNFFCDNENGRAFISISPSEIIKKKYNSNLLFLIYSMKNSKVESDFEPISFYPVAFDNDKNMIVGVQVRDNKIFLQFYEV